MRKSKYVKFAALMLSTAMLFGCGGSQKPAETAKAETAKTVNAETEAVGKSANTSGEATAEKEADQVKIDEEAILTRAVPVDLYGLIPINQSMTDAQEMILPMFDPLFRVHSDGVQYFLAESYTVSDDNTSVTVKLRDGLTWHDGEAIDADDLVWNFEMYKANKLNKSMVTINGNSIATEKLDDLTVKFTLPEPSVAYAPALGKLQMIPEHIYKDEPDVLKSSANENGIGSGPYKLKEWNKGENLILERNDSYYGGKMPIKTMVFRIIPNSSAEEVAFEAKELSYMKITNATDLAKYENRDDVELYSFPEGRNHYLAFNALSDIMKNPKAREAVCLAINDQEMIQGVYGSERIARPGQNIFTSANLFYPEGVTNYEQNLNRAKELAKESGLEGQTLRVIYNSSKDNFEDIGLMLQQQLKAINVNVELQGFDANAFLSELFQYEKDGSYDIGINGYSTTGDPNPQRKMFSTTSKKNVITTEKMEELWIQGDQVSDPAKRTEIYAGIAQEMKDVFSMYVVADTNIVIVAQKGYKGLDCISPLLTDYTKVYKEAE